MGRQVKDRCASTLRNRPRANPVAAVTQWRWGVSFSVIQLWIVNREPPTVTVNAYILIQAEVGSAADVAQATADLPQITLSEVAVGPYDVIARATADDMDELGGVVVNAVGNIPGVERTLLCPIVNL